MLFAGWEVFPKAETRDANEKCKETKNRKQERIGCSEGEKTQNQTNTAAATTSPESVGGPKTNLFQLRVLIGRSWAVVVVSGGEAGLGEGCRGGLMAMIVVRGGNVCGG